MRWGSLVAQWPSGLVVPFTSRFLGYPVQGMLQTLILNTHCPEGGTPRLANIIPTPLEHTSVNVTLKCDQI